MQTLTFDAGSGQLTLHTGVAGSAAKMGHRLVIEVTDWHASADIDAEQVHAVKLVAQLPSLKVRSGEGGVKPLSDGDRDTIAGNARRALDTGKYPTVEFTFAGPIDLPTGPGDFPLRGKLRIHGREQAIAATLQVGHKEAGWTLHVAVPVVQSDYGIKAYSTMLGQLRVADEVTVQLDLKPFQVG